jgi:ribosomal protein L32
MVISPYQVNNVLRVYGDQLRQPRVSSKPKSGKAHLPAKISSSGEPKRKAVIDKVASRIIERITRYGPDQDVEKEVFQKLKDQYGANLDIDGKAQNDLIFKVIDENGETIQSLSIEDSRFLSNKLKEIARDTVDKSMMKGLED